MQKYEGFFIFHPQTEEDGLKRKIEEVERYIISQKGTVEKSKDPFRERLPYPIKKCQEGIYFISSFEIPLEAVDGLKKKYLKDENVLRYTIIRKPNIRKPKAKVKAK